MKPLFEAPVEAAGPASTQDESNHPSDHVSLVEKGDTTHRLSSQLAARSGEQVETVEAPSFVASAGKRPTSVTTRVRLAAPAEKVWKTLMFYEQIKEPLPLLLRLLLPAPIRMEGRKSEVGDEARCEYRGGHLLKRVTRIIPRRNYAFEVIEQSLHVGGGIRLLGGCYTLRELRGGHTEVVLRTRYVSPYHPRWLCRGVEAVVCHSFHRYILGAMRGNM